MSNIQFDYENKIKQSQSEKVNKEAKYSDDDMFESWADVNIFFPISINLVDPLY